MRWRWHRYAIVTDIEKMYHQILVFPEDRDYQRILWRHDHWRHPRIQTEHRDIRFCVRVVSCHLAHFVNSLTIKNRNFLEARPYRDSYVDDIVTKVDTLTDAIVLLSELRGLCTADRFLFRKWTANCGKIPYDRSKPNSRFNLMKLIPYFSIGSA